MTCPPQVAFCKKFSWILSSDALVVQEMAKMSPALLPFLTLYPLLLTLAPRRPQTI